MGSVNRRLLAFLLAFVALASLVFAEEDFAGRSGKRGKATPPVVVAPVGPAYPRYEALEFANLEGAGFTQAGVRTQIGKQVRGRSMAIFGQGAFEVAAHYFSDDPLALIKIAADSNANCEVGWYINALQFPLTQPAEGQFVYSPFGLEVYTWIDSANAWLRNSSGTIIQGATGWGVFDVRANGLGSYYGTRAQYWMRRYGIHRIFLDETHYTIAFLPAYSTIVNPPSDAQQTAGITTLLTATAGGERSCNFWNGTLLIPSCPDAFGGRMLQQAYSSSYSSIASQMQTVVARWAVGQRYCLLEQPSLTTGQAQYVVCLSALYDGSSGCGNSTFTDPALKMPWTAASFGRPVEYVNHTATTPVLTVVGSTVSREFEHATVSVNTSSKTGSVTYH